MNFEPRGTYIAHVEVLSDAGFAFPAATRRKSIVIKILIKPNGASPLASSGGLVTSCTCLFLVCVKDTRQIVRGFFATMTAALQVAAELGIVKRRVFPINYSDFSASREPPGNRRPAPTPSTGKRLRWWWCSFFDLWKIEPDEKCFSRRRGREQEFQTLFQEV